LTSGEGRTTQGSQGGTRSQPASRRNILPRRKDRGKTGWNLKRTGSKKNGSNIKKGFPRQSLLGECKGEKKRIRTGLAEICIEGNRIGEAGREKQGS